MGLDVATGGGGIQRKRIVQHAKLSRGRTQGGIYGARLGISSLFGLFWRFGRSWRLSEQHLVQYVFRERLRTLIIQSLHGLETKLKSLLDTALQLSDEQGIEPDLDERGRRVDIIEIDFLGGLAENIFHFRDQPFRQGAGAFRRREFAEPGYELLARFRNVFFSPSLVASSDDRESPQLAQFQALDIGQTVTAVGNDADPRDQRASVAVHAHARMAPQLRECLVAQGYRLDRGRYKRPRWVDRGQRTERGAKDLQAAIERRRVREWMVRSTRVRGRADPGNRFPGSGLSYP